MPFVSDTLNRLPRLYYLHQKVIQESADNVEKELTYEWSNHTSACKNGVIRIGPSPKDSLETPKDH